MNEFLEPTSKAVFVSGLKVIGTTTWPFFPFTPPGL